MSALKLGWHAVQVRPRHERYTSMLLGQRGYRQFLPLHKVRRARDGQARIVEVPLFPGYVFCYLGQEPGPKIVTTPGVIRIVGTGATADCIPDYEIESIRNIVASGIPARPCDYLRTGQRVIVHGPLKGAEGIVIGHGNSVTLVVSVNLLQRAVAVKIDEAWATPMQDGPMAPMHSAIARRH